MKFFSKIFITVTLILCVSLSLSGYFLISLSFQNGIKQEKSQALEQYKITRFALQSGLVSIKNDKLVSENASSSLMPEALLSHSDSSMVAVFSDEKEALYSQYPADYDFSILQSADPQKLVFEIRPAGNSYVLTAAGCFSLDSKTYYLLYGKDIQTILQQREQMEHSFSVIYCMVCTLSVLALLAISLLFVRPLKQLTRFAADIAEGDYSRRVSIRTRDELGELADTCNHMAEAIQKSIDTLTREAVQKEDFVANFAHELKTPLTSVIGYADMIYQKDLTKAEIRSAAWYILDEGLRLEELSQKLMDLIVLNRQDFMLEELSAAELLENLSETLRPVCESRKVSLRYEADDSYIHVEYDLFKTLLLNLVDNGIKAGASSIRLTGKSDEKNYTICVSDNGCGIPEEEISRITEAFYMLDKSRSRKQHGAGIGLALVSRICELHHAQLKFESEPGHGTTVFIILSEKDC
ncbi:MAG: HAMP domain-containing sensor histidine kinase [Lachnospiraceae bacterium]|nr:HAMP domain-containing sensor histidine kinase [Lachnospiraceae bacterium]